MGCHTVFPSARHNLPESSFNKTSTPETTCFDILELFLLENNRYDTC